MHPYRTADKPQASPDPSSVHAQDRWLHWLLLVVGLVPVASAVLRRDCWGAEPSVGLLLVMLAAPSLFAHYGRGLRRALRR